MLTAATVHKTLSQNFFPRRSPTIHVLEVKLNVCCEDDVPLTHQSCDRRQRAHVLLVVQVAFFVPDHYGDVKRVTHTSPIDRLVLSRPLENVGGASDAGIDKDSGSHWGRASGRFRSRGYSGGARDVTRSRIRSLEPTRLPIVNAARTRTHST